MARPPARDDETLTRILQRLKNDVAALAARTVQPVGKRWRVEEDKRTGHLVAVAPSTDQRVVLAGPEPEAASPEPQISTDDGNRLTTGADQGLYVGPGKPGTSCFGFTGAGIPPGTSMYTVSTEADEDYLGAFDYPDDEIGRVIGPYNTTVDDPQVWWPGPWVFQFTAESVISDQHADPRTGVSVQIPTFTRLINTSTGPTRSRILMPLSPYDEEEKEYARPEWSGNLLKMEMTVWLTGYPTALQSTYGPAGVWLMQFMPGGGLVLTQDGLLVAMNGWNTNRTQVAGSSYDELPLNRLVNLRWWMSRDGSKDLCYIYYDDPAKPDQEFDDWIPMHDWNDSNRPVCFDNMFGEVPSFGFGPHLFEYWFVPPLPTDGTRGTLTITVPGMWMSNVSVTFDHPPVIWFPLRPGDPRNSSISGVVTNAAGTPVPGATVTLYLSIPFALGDVAGVKVTDAAGRYQFTGQAFRAYKIRAKQEPAGPLSAITQVFIDQNNPSRVVNLTVG